jgi:hypothetical protein
MKTMQGGIQDFDRKYSIQMATITTGFAGCRAGRGHRKMLTFHNISQHFRDIDASLRRIPGNTEIDPIRDLSEAIKSHQKPSSNGMGGAPYHLSQARARCQCDIAVQKKADAELPLRPIS